MPINKVEFINLEDQISATMKSHLDCLAPDIGKVYVVAITRDGCSACEKQKPRLTELAKSVEEKLGNRVVFIRLHVTRPVNSEAESLRSKDLLGHYFYPTNLVLIRTRDRGAIEYYRNVSPEIEELERIAERALEIAKIIEKEAV